MKKLLIILFCLLLGAYSVQAGLYKATITFSGYTKNETLTNFPALIVLSNNIPSGFSYTQLTSTNGWDLRFTDSTNSTLNYEIETWNTGGASFVWVQVPLLTSNAQITMSWGGTNTAQPAYTTNGATWTNGYAGVWHLPNGTSLTGNDSTSNNINGTLVNSPVAIAGKIDGAASFNGTSQYIELGDTLAMNGQSITIDMWLYPMAWPATSYFYNLFSRRQVSNPWIADYLLYMDAGGQIGLAKYNGSWEDTTPTAGLAPTGQWSQVAVTFDTSTKLASLFVNGVLVKNKTFTAAIGANGSATTRIGGVFYTTDTKYINGYIDDTRISNVSRSSNWVWACYQNMASNNVFQSYGSATIVVYSLYRPNTTFRKNLAIKNQHGGQ